MTEPAFTPERFSSPEEQKAWFAKVQKTVAVDFDGVLHPYTKGWTGPCPDDEPPMSGAKEFLRTLQRLQYKVIIFSTRAEMSEGLIGIENWLDKYNLNDYVLKVTHEKPPAIAYVDDRAVAFTGENWAECILNIQALDAHKVHGAAK